MDKRLKQLIYISFAVIIMVLPGLGNPSDSTKSTSPPSLMPAHGSPHSGDKGSPHGGAAGSPHGDMSELMNIMPKDTLPDSLKYPREPFDSTLLTATFVLETRHKLFPKFYQLDTVLFGQTFTIGDEDEYSAKVIRFNPHLAITTKGEFKRMSDTLYNPAVQVEVMKGDSLVQRTWAFHFIDAPHFRADAFLGFKLTSFTVNQQKYIKAPDRK